MFASAQALWAAENRIFAVWQRREPTLLRDGALGGRQSTWTSAPFRVLFVLKEPNDSEQRWSAHGADLRLHTASFADLRSTFPVILLLAHLAQQSTTDPSLSLSFADTRIHLRDPAVRLRLLHSIALVNLKKTPGGPVCKDRSLELAVQSHATLLRRQLALYQPHLTLAGGSSVHTLLASLLRTPVLPATPPCTRPFFHHSDLGLCLSFFHPQATKAYEYLFHLLRDNLLAQGLPGGLSTRNTASNPESRP